MLALSTVAAIIKLVAALFVLSLSLVVVAKETIKFFINKKIEKEMKKDWENKTGVYSYLKK